MVKTEKTENKVEIGLVYYFHICCIQSYLNTLFEDGKVNLKDTDTYQLEIIRYRSGQT